MHDEMKLLTVMIFCSTFSRCQEAKKELLVITGNARNDRTNLELYIPTPDNPVLLAYILHFRVARLQSISLSRN